MWQFCQQDQISKFAKNGIILFLTRVYTKNGLWKALLKLQLIKTKWYIHMQPEKSCNNRVVQISVLDRICRFVIVKELSCIFFDKKYKKKLKSLF